ncbi:8211_t:CDS:2, partial [Scutellospora calospora]
QFNPTDPVSFQEIEVQEILTIPQTVKDHLEKVLMIHNKVNKQLEKTRKQIQKNSSIHCCNNTYKPGQTVVSMTNNNKTIIVETSKGSTICYLVKK